MMRRLLVAGGLPAVGLAAMVLLTAGTAHALERPDGPVLGRYVRVDMECPAVAPGIAAAMPVEVRPLRIVAESKLPRYARYGLPPTGFAFKNPRGLYELYRGDEAIPAKTLEMTFPPAFSAYFRSVIRGSNPVAYGDLDLDAHLDVLGVAGWGATGQDLSSVLPLPFTNAPGGDISRSLSVLFIEGYKSPNEGRFTVWNHEAPFETTMDEMGLGPQALAFYADRRGQVGNRYLTELWKKNPDYGLVVDAMYSENFKSGDNSTFDVSLCFSKTTTSVVNYRTFSASPRTSPIPADAIVLDYWPNAEKTGWCELSSFSEPGKGPRAGRTVLYLTPLTVFDKNLASMAIRHEMPRALRNQWLLHGCPSTNLVATKHAGAFREALLRMTVPLVEYLASSNALEGYIGADAYASVAGLPRGRYTNNLADIVGRLLRPSLGRSADMGLPDCNVGSYFHPLDEHCDHRYGRAVYQAWVSLAETSQAKLVDNLLDALASGYARSTRTMDLEPAVLAWLGVDRSGVTSFAAGGVDLLDRLKSRYNDLEWVAQAILPKDSTNPAVPGALLTTAEVQDCQLTPLIYPFRKLHTMPEGTRLVSLVRDTGVASINGLPWTTNPADTYVALGDLIQVNDFDSLCSNLWSSFVVDQKLTSTWATARTTWNESRANAVISSTTPAAEDLKAAYFYHQRTAYEALGEIRARMRNVAPAYRLGIVKIATSDGGKTRTLVPLGSSGPSPGTTETITDLFVQVPPLVDKFANYAKVGTKGQQPFDSVCMKVKDKFWKDLTSRVLVPPTGFPRRMFELFVQGSRMSSTASYTAVEALARLSEAGRLLGQPTTFARADGTAFVPVLGGR